MRDSQIVRIYKSKPVKFEQTSKDEFTFRRDKKHHWLQKLCFSILGKIGAYRTFMNERIDYIQIDTDDFVKNIFAQKYNIYDMCLDEECEIFIGNKDFTEIMRQDTNGQFMSFNAKYEVASANHRELMGMKVTVIPWMEGILVVPKRRIV